MSSNAGSPLSLALVQGAGLTAGCRGPAPLLLTGMELGPFREEVGVCVLLRLGSADGPLGREDGAAAAGVFFMKGDK